MNNQILDNTQKGVIEKRPIASTLRDLEVGNSTLFPKSQYDSLYAASRRLEDIDGIVVKIVRGKDSITVTRTA